MRHGRLLAFAAAAVLTLCSARSASAADVGDKAPEIAASEWIQGEPLKIADEAGSRTTLVVLWRTFCEGIGEEFSHLDKIYKDRKDKKLEVVAFTTEPPDVAKGWLASHKVEFRIGIDQFHAVQDAYLKKDDRQMPVAWLVDKTGVIVWKGGIWGCEGMIDQVLAGKFDLEKSKEQAAVEESMWTAYEAEDWKKLAAESDKMLALEPNHSLAFDFRLTVFRELNDRTGYEKFMKLYMEAAKDDVPRLVRASNMFLSQPGNTFHARSFSGWMRLFSRGDSKSDDWRNVDMAFTAARRAVDASKSADSSALSAYVRVLTTVGLLDEAIEAQKKVVALDAKNEDNAKYLAYLNACAAARRKVTGKK